jgi:lipase chaperone LimK
MRGRFVLLAVVVVALVGEMALRPTRVARRPAAAMRRPALVAPAAAAAGLLPPPPASLDGTDVDGRLVVDAHGDLVVSPEVRRFFEYFLSATGEDEDAAIRRRVEAAIDARVPPRAAAQARALFDRFLAYREAARGLQASPSDSLATRLAAVREIRWKTFGRQAADALFGDEDLKDDAAIEPRAAAVTTPAEREAELRETALRDGGAERLQALDRARADWQRRLDAFRAERARGGDGDDSVKQLLAASFTAEEAVRVRALERIAGHPIP